MNDKCYVCGGVMLDYPAKDGSTLRGGRICKKCLDAMRNVGPSMFAVVEEILAYFATYEKDYNEILPCFERARTMLRKVKSGPCDLSPEEFANHNGALCPVCQSKDLDCDSETGYIDSGVFRMDGWCGRCESSWLEVYRLVGYEQLRRREQ